MHSAYRRIQRSEEYQDYAEIIQAVKEFQFQPGRLLLVYQWRPEMMTQIQIQGQSLLISEDDQERLRIYNNRLVAVAQNIHDSQASVTTLFRPLFGFAIQRANSGEDPIADNRMLVFLLALYANKQELDDSKGGARFSFADLAADRAGIRFAELATRTSQAAQQLQRRVSQVKSETEFMSRVDNLPEGIMALELKQQYGNLDSASYRMINAEIDHRIAACWIYN